MHKMSTRPEGKPAVAEERDDMRTLLCALMLALSMVAHAAPDWFKDIDVCNGWYGDWDDSIMAKMQDVPFVVAANPTSDILTKAHKLNTRILACVTFCEMPRNEYYQHLNISEHPGWVCIHADGREGESALHKGSAPKWVTTCPNTIGFHDYAVKTVRLLMEQGMDGIFIDNGQPDTVCEGPKFGKHKHIYPNKNNTYAYRRLLEDIHDEVRRFGDKIVIVNPGSPREDWVGACDGQMLESYICSRASKNRWPESKILAYRNQVGSYPGKGCAIVALSYVGGNESTCRDDAFYCFAWARLSGFIWADWFTGKTCAKDLYLVRLGPADGPMETHDGYYSRTFKNGMVVATSETKGASFNIPAKDRSDMLDLYNAQILQPGKSGDYEIILDKGQGRVYTW